MLFTGYKEDAQIKNGSKVYGHKQKSTTAAEQLILEVQIVFFEQI